MKATVLLQLDQPESGKFTMTRTIDGDTLVGTIFAWSSAVLIDIPVLAITVQAAPVRIEIREAGIRLWSEREHLGIDCPEKTGVTKTAGLTAWAFTNTWLSTHIAHDSQGMLKLAMIGRDSFRRVLSDVICTDDDSHLASELLDSGNATFWS